MKEAEAAAKAKLDEKQNLKAYRERYRLTLDNQIANNNSMKQ